MRATAEYLAGMSGGEGGRSYPMHVKASGGVRSAGDAVRFLEAGATRLGTSGSVAIVKEARGGLVMETGKHVEAKGGY